MGLFDFGKKKEAPVQQPKAPVDEVVRMRRQGFSNNQVVQTLQRNGYQTSQIFDALSQADLRAPSPVQGVQGTQAPGSLGNPPNAPPPPFGEEMERDANIEGPQSPEELPGFVEEGENTEGTREFSAMGSAPAEPSGQGGYGAGYGSYGGREVSAKIEEISEAIIEEKWQDLMKDFGKLTEWKSSVEQRMAAIEQRVADMKTAFDNLQKSVVDKVSDYDESVKNVSSEMKALEQVFQKIIPTLTENVNELSRITKGMKAPPASRKQ